MLKDIKCSGNWMWPAKLPGEGATLLEACSAMCDVMKRLGIAVDGGKDSLSMAARVGETTVKSPGQWLELVTIYVTLGVHVYGHNIFFSIIILKKFYDFYCTSFRISQREIPSFI